MIEVLRVERQGVGPFIRRSGEFNRRMIDLGIPISKPFSTPRFDRRYLYGCIGRQQLHRYFLGMWDLLEREGHEVVVYQVPEERLEINRTECRFSIGCRVGEMGIREFMGGV